MIACHIKIMHNRQARIQRRRYYKTRCVTSKVNEAVKIKRFSVIDDIEQDTHGMGQDFGMPEIQ